MIGERGRTIAEESPKRTLLKVTEEDRDLQIPGESRITGRH